MQNKAEYTPSESQYKQQSNSQATRGFGKCTHPGCGCQMFNQQTAVMCTCGHEESWQV
jgi:hypothetical protein